MKKIIKENREFIGIPIDPNPYKDAAKLIVELTDTIAELDGTDFDAERTEQTLQHIIDDGRGYVAGLYEQIVREPEKYMENMSLPTLRKLIALGIELYGYCPSETLDLLQAMQIGWTDIRNIDEIMQLPMQFTQLKPNHVHDASYFRVTSSAAFIKHLHYRTDNYFIQLYKTDEISLLEIVRKKVTEQSIPPKILFANMINEFCRYPILFIAGLSSNELLQLDASVNAVNHIFYHREKQDRRFLEQLQRARLLIRFAYLGAQKREETK